eukprot:GEMP01022466.1.p1 GENE.GEMP01022466.1~~GEMP01022466.1.p1  ORF type:complete len:373 (+),score=77.90 GEMP01022466.1:84-1202(+)
MFKKGEKALKLPWNEKYRPQKIEDIAEQDHVTSNLINKTLKTGELPHLLFYGPPGTGKTTTALALVKELFGPIICKQRVMEMNASDDRGIKAIREKIKPFARLKVGRKDPNYPCPPYKIIILDEADSMTHDAQAALRRTMEEFMKDTRFILCCNYVSKIIDPLQSRCNSYRFQPVGREGLLRRLKYIAEQEAIDIDEEALNTIIDVSEGDCRRSIGYLQSAYQAFAVNEDGTHKRITPEAIETVASVVPRRWSEKLVQTCISGTIEEVDAAAQDFLCEGFAHEAVLLSFKDALINMNLPCYQLAKIALAIAEIDGLYYVKGVPAKALIPQLMAMTHHYSHSPDSVREQDGMVRRWWSDVKCDGSRLLGRVYW